MGAANVGPEFTISEYDALMELEGIEKRLHAEGRVAVCSDMKNVLWKLVDESNRWRKWLLESEKGHHFNELSEERKLWISADKLSLYLAKTGGDSRSQSTL